MRPAPARAVRRDRLGPVLIGAVLAAGTALVVWWNPGHGGPVLCPLLALTGYYCPTCGGLRTVSSLATGDLAGAWAMNPMLTVALPVLGLLWARWLWRSWRNVPPRNPPAWLFATVAAALVLFGVARNIPVLHGYLGPG
ncbi:DUF2752 domain-containing protein [Ruania zhangjianzhongii]|uniref:DUF2752 domain-containing protein n=1 Tax=Ruania zhangjianzhongii TaxID=2603206 RepID=UPI0011CBEAEE|nr:DUF2752 domain-containing protein [Ruania zhangjianzhongii]